MEKSEHLPNLKIHLATQGDSVWGGKLNNLAGNTSEKQYTNACKHGRNVFFKKINLQAK